jgi:hypothetical protein
MARNNAETRLQCKIVSDLPWLLPRDTVLMSIPNGGKMTDSARKKAAGMGEYPGAADLLVLWDCKALFMEVKVRRSKTWNIPATTYQKDNQIAFQADVEAAGAHYCVVRSVDEALAFLRAHGVPTREKVPA